VYYRTFAPPPELRDKPKSYRGPQRSLLHRTLRIGIRRKGSSVVPGSRAMLYCPGVATPSEAFSVLDAGVHALKFPLLKLLARLVSKQCWLFRPKEP